MQEKVRQERGPPDTTYNSLSWNHTHTISSRRNTMIKKNEKGFTLIELLVVVAIIGILAAIAIPQFAAYREQAFCGTVESDVKNTVTAQEAEFAENQAYDPTITVFTPGTTVAVTLAGTGLGTVTGDRTDCTRGSGTYTFTAAAGTYSW